MHTYILLFQCRDRSGIVAGISDLVLRQRGNIVTADQHSTDPEGGHFFMRVEFVTDTDKAALKDELAQLAKKFDATFGLYDKTETMRMGIMVSRPDHCLMELLYLWRAGELRVDIPFVISNYPGHRELVEQFKVPFHYIAAAKDDRREEEILGLVKEETDFIVLARYMQVLSESFLNSYGRDIINIHHGFLPSFKGAEAYRQALENGVKVIGATAHFVTGELDNGPIIAQEVSGVSHKDNLESLVRKGRNLEKLALSQAVSGYVDHRIIRHRNTTIVF